MLPELAVDQFQLTILAGDRSTWAVSLLVVEEETLLDLVVTPITRHWSVELLKER